jgi:hypothetical protein
MCFVMAVILLADRALKAPKPFPESTPTAEVTPRPATRIWARLRGRLAPRVLRRIHPLVLASAVLIVVGVVLAMTGGSRAGAGLVLALAVLCAVAVVRVDDGPGHY